MPVPRVVKKIRWRKIGRQRLLLSSKVNRVGQRATTPKQLRAMKVAERLKRKPTADPLEFRRTHYYEGYRHYGHFTLKDPFKKIEKAKTNIELYEIGASPL